MKNLRMKTNSIYSFLLAFCFGISSCGMSEKELYDQAAATNTPASYSLYLETFPDGEYADEALFNICKLMDFDLEYDIDYIRRFPNGTHISEVGKEYNNIWQQIESNYNNANNNNFSEGTLFMKNLLKWMKENHICTINVSVEPEFNMKDYTDYPDPVVKSIEAFMKSKGADENDYISYREYGKKEIDYAYELIKNRIKVFFPYNTIKILCPKESEYDKKSAKATVSCNIHPVEDNEGFPEVWDIYNAKGSLSCFVMSICLDYKFVVNVPNADKAYSCSGHIVPKDEFQTTQERTSSCNGLLLSCVEGMLDEIFGTIGIGDTK